MGGLVVGDHRRALGERHRVGQLETVKAGATAISANAPNATVAQTRLPPATPATSMPGTNGSGGRIWYSPLVTSQSTKPTPAAWTSIATMPSGASGAGKRPRGAGPRGRCVSWRTSARIAAVSCPDGRQARALAEDIGAGDVTAAATVPAGRARGVATITQKAPGVIFGLEAAEAAFRRSTRRAELERLGDGGRVARGGGAGAARSTGSTRARSSAPSAPR